MNLTGSRLWKITYFKFKNQTILPTFCGVFSVTSKERINYFIFSWRNFERIYFLYGIFPLFLSLLDELY
jgi:hypothetical protein